MLRQQCKTSRNIKNQGHMILPKEQKNFPVTNPKEIRICDSLDKEFKIAVLRKFNELLENTER